MNSFDVCSRFPSVYFSPLRRYHYRLPESASSPVRARLVLLTVQGVVVVRGDLLPGERWATKGRVHDDTLPNIFVENP